jgi:uncharacterized membrane protein
MKLILTPFVWLMVPLAFIVLAYDIAKAYVEEKVETKIKEKNNG